MPRAIFFGHNPKVQVSIQPNIGLDAAARQSVVEILKTIQADEAVLLIKTRSVDGHGSGTGVPDLQPLFDAQYKQLDDISNEIAERIRIMGSFPLGSPEEFLNSARLEERTGRIPDIIKLLADHEAFIRFLRVDAQKCSEECEDQGTFALLVSILRIHEKIAWMLRSNIDPERFAKENRESKLQPTKRQIP